MSHTIIHYGYNILHIYILYILNRGGGKHAESVCRMGIYPHKEGITRKREHTVRRDKHKRKIRPRV